MAIGFPLPAGPWITGSPGAAYRAGILRHRPRRGQRAHRPAIRYCLDWSEQRHHLAGPLGTALTNRLFELNWIRRGRGRVVTLTDAGESGFDDRFGVRLEP